MADSPYALVAPDEPDESVSDMLQELLAEEDFQAPISIREQQARLHWLAAPEEARCVRADQVRTPPPRVTAAWLERSDTAIVPLSVGRELLRPPDRLRPLSHS